ncbi:hydrogenase maturation protease [Alloiococcus sp. CFN-8]|uniref:hydrogenase maturation protease n=1 Tax=Alloiococcus sp. CFN-8 TaxID=3416081 RepID=UPI003CE69069
MACYRNKVVAIGNIMMADDGIGVWVAKALKNYLIERDVELIIGETDVEYCLDSLEDGDKVIILDAAFTGGEIGRVSTHSLDELGYRGIGLTQHKHNLVEAIKLYRRDIKGILIEIEIADVSFGLGISETMKVLFSEVVEETKRSIESHIGGGKCTIQLY